MYKGLLVTQTDIKSNYKLLTKEEAGHEDWIDAPVLVATNQEQFTLIEERARVFARHHGTHVIRWPHDMKEWEQQPPDAFVNQAMDDPIFWEHFVINACGFLNESIQKELRLPIRYHALKFEKEFAPLLDHMVATTPPGEVIDMPIAPENVIVEVFVPDHTDIEILDALHELSLEKPKRNRHGFIRSHSNRVLLPLRQFSCSWDTTPTVIRGSYYFLPSRALFRNLFPIELGFSITVHKSLGKTLRKVIIALSSCGVHSCNFSFQQLLVAFSRVRNGDHIRLLLTGNTEEAKWESIIFINRLKRDPSLAYFFAGFRDIDNLDDINHGWIDDVWSEERANAKFEAMLDKGIF